MVLILKKKQNITMNEEGFNGKICLLCVLWELGVTTTVLEYGKAEISYSSGQMK